MARATVSHASHRAGRFYTLIFIACVVLLGVALYLQHWKNLDPCPWCVVQRIGFMLIGLVALLAALHRPARSGIAVYGGLVSLVSIGGIAAAGYQIYLQMDPKRALSCAGSAVERILDKLALGKLIPPLLQYDGPCTLKPWSLLGMSIPEWSLIWFGIFLIAALTIPFLSRR